MFAVDAAFFASENETFEGSLRSAFAVFSASRFCAHVVPVLLLPAGSVGVDRVDSLEKLDWRVFIGELCAPAKGVAGAGDGGKVPDRGATGGGTVRPISKPGTETPAFPSLFSAP